MIQNSWVLGLVTGQVVLLFVYTIAVVSAWAIVQHWDFASHSEQQYRLEKQTYLISTLMKFTLMAHLLMLFLLVVSADELAQVLPGAMCATGTLSANGYGFPLFWLEVGCFFLFFVWLVINQVDSQSESYPLIREKYAIIVAAFPLIILKSALLLLFVTNLNPGVITSCCGSVFTETSSGMGGSISGIPPKIILTVFFGTVVLIVLLVVKEASSTLGKSDMFRWVEIPVWLSFFIAAILTIISFLSTYVYQLPTHKCPFCLLKGEYYYIGFPIYLGLFTATAAGISNGALGFFDGKVPPGPELARLQRNLNWTAGAGVMLFLISGFGPFLAYYLRTGAII